MNGVPLGFRRDPRLAWIFACEASAFLVLSILCEGMEFGFQEFQYEPF
jgi:hypothetical protein